MNSLKLFLNYYPILMVAAPIFLVLRLRLRGVFYGMFIFWLFGVAGNLVRSSLTGSSDSLWLMLGLPIGLLYSGIVYGIYGCFRWIGPRFVPAKAGVKTGFWMAIFIAAMAGALFWQFRPYGAGTSSMIYSLNQCPPEQVKFLWNEPWYFHNRGVIDLKNDSYRVDGDDESDGNFGNITLTCGISSLNNTLLSPAQLTKIRELIDALPSRHKIIFQRFDFNRHIYVSLWKNDRLQIFEYDRTNLPQGLSDLFDLLGPNIAKAVRGDR